VFREITVAKQAETGPKRRWYQSDYFDLFVFYFRHGERADAKADREFVGLQLCYDIRRNQRTLEWKKDAGFSHHRVNKGADTLSDHGASASLLEKGGTFDAGAVLNRFMRESEGLPPIVRKLVMEKLAEYARSKGGPISEGSLRETAPEEAPADLRSGSNPVSEPFEPG
jgi:hypothetical protein